MSLDTENDVDVEDVLRLLRRLYVDLFPRGDRQVAAKVCEVIAEGYERDAVHA